jgi:hypothetical protein
MLLLPMQVNERLPLMPVATDDDAGYDHNDRHSGVESQQGILDVHHKVPHAPQKAHICSCAEVFARAAQEGASATANGQLATRSRRWRNHQQAAACLAIYGPSTPVGCMVTSCSNY